MGAIVGNPVGRFVGVTDGSLVGGSVGVKEVGVALEGVFVGTPEGA